ncbi:MAG: beta strand repeat-containing protein [Opitutaceae bacterium]
MHHIKHTYYYASAIAACLLAIPAVDAQTTRTWDTVNAADTDWSVATNWVDDTAPVAGDDVVINGDGTFAPTNNSAFTADTFNSLTLEGATTVTLSSALSIGAGGVFNNMVTNSLNLKAVDLTTDSTWGGTRTIFVGGAVTGSKMIWTGSGLRFDQNSPAWASGIDAYANLGMNDLSSDAGTTITPYGTGTLTLINQSFDTLSNVNLDLTLATSANNLDLATAVTLANDITLSDPGIGNFSISQNNDSSTLLGGHFFRLTGTISGAVNTARTLSFTNSKGVNAPATFILEGANTHTAQTVTSDDYVTLALGNVDAVQNSTLDTGAADATKQVTFSVAGTNTYNLGGLAGADDLDFGANSLSIGSNNSDGTFSGALSGSGDITKTGTGTTTFSGTNIYTGTTTVSDGTLVATTPASLPGYNSPASVIFDGGTIAVPVGAGGWLDADLSDLLTNATKTSGFIGIDTSLGDYTQTSAYNFSPLGLDVLGSNKLTLDQANTYTGGTTFAGASLIVAAEGALGTGAVVGDTASGNTVLTFNTPSDATFANDITSGANGSGIVNDSATSAITLNGNVVLNRATTFQGFQGTGVNNAGFVIGGNVSSTTRLTLKDTNMTLAATGTLGPTFSARVTLGDVGGDGSAVYVADGADFTLRIQDSQNTTISNDAMTFIVGMNTAGTGTFSSSDSVNLLANGSSVANDWEFTAVTGATVNFTGKIISNNGNANAADVTVTKTGDGTVVFANTNTYLGDTTISAGTLQIGNGGGTGSLSPDSTITNDGALIFNNTSGLVQGTDFSTAPITGSGSLSIVGGNVTLNAVNTYSGGTTIDGGTLTVGAAAAVPAGAITGINASVVAFDTPANVTFSDDLTLATASNTGLVNNSTTSTVTLEGTVELTAPFAAIVGTGVNNAGFVLGNGGVLKAGAASRMGLKDTSLTFQVGGAVDYSGTGFKRITLADSTGTGAAVYLEDTVDLDMVIYDTNNSNVTSDTMEFIVGMKSAGTATFSGLSGVSVDLNHRNNVGSLANEWEFTAVAGATANFTGSIANANTNSQASINKTGDGTVSFQASNSYTGDTTVTAGTLQLASGGILTFAPTANGVNNQIDGTASGTLDLDGEIFIDLSLADTTDLNSWLLIDGSAMTVAYDAATFTVNSSAGALTENTPGVWTLVDGSNTWTFTESTGTLSLANAGPAGPTDEEISSDEFVSNYSFDGTTASFSFQVFAGSTYEIRRTDDLTVDLASWTTVYGPTAQVGDATITPSDVPGALLDEAFYVLIITDTP